MKKHRQNLQDTETNPNNERVEAMIFCYENNAVADKSRFIITKSFRQYHVYKDTIAEHELWLRQHLADFFTEGAAKHFVKKMTE